MCPLPSAGPGNSGECPDTVKPKNTKCGEKNPHYPCDADDFCKFCEGRASDRAFPKHTDSHSKPQRRPCGMLACGAIALVHKQQACARNNMLHLCCVLGMLDMWRHLSGTAAKAYPCLHISHSCTCCVLQVMERVPSAPTCLLQRPQTLVAGRPPALATSKNSVSGHATDPCKGLVCEPNHTHRVTSVDAHSVAWASTPAVFEHIFSRDCPVSTASASSSEPVASPSSFVSAYPSSSC